MSRTVTCLYCQIFIDITHSKCLSPKGKHTQVTPLSFEFQSCGAVLRNAAGQQIQIVPTVEEGNPVSTQLAEMKGPKDSPSRVVV